MKRLWFIVALLFGFAVGFFGGAFIYIACCCDSARNLLC